MLKRKAEIIAFVTPLLPTDQAESVDHALISWWHNCRLDGGMRLTHRGYNMLATAGIESWSYAIEHLKHNSRLLVELDRKLEWPYYIDFKNQQLVMFSDRDAASIRLYGDLNLWLNSKTVRS